MGRGTAHQRVEAHEPSVVRSSGGGTATSRANAAAKQLVAQRAVTNYLAGQRTNLLADLDPAAVVSLPTTVLDVRSVRSITKAAEDRVAVEVAAADDAGIQWTLRYELTVVHRDRWYVRAIEPDPVAAGGRP
jgi:hypothetical protein